MVTQKPTDELASRLKRTEIQHHPSSISGREIVQVLTEIPAGVESGWHKHPGEEVGYILAGTVEMRIEGQPTLTLHEGDGLRTVLTRFQSGPGSLDGTVGDETLRLAIEDAMNDFKPDHLIIGIRTHDHDSWQERHLIENVRHRFHVPLTVFEIDDQGQSPAPAYNND